MRVDVIVLEIETRDALHVAALISEFDLINPLPREIGRGGHGFILRHTPFLWMDVI